MMLVPDPGADQLALQFINEAGTEMLLATGLVTAAAALLLGVGAIRGLKVWQLGLRVRREVKVVDRPGDQLRRALGEMPLRDLGEQPVPIEGDQDARYQLTQRLIAVLREFGYRSVTVLVDRVDEPALVNGEPQRMRSLIWPMLSNKFLQQDGVAIKLLLPIELRHLLHREDAEFFQRARLDKQHLVDRQPHEVVAFVLVRPLALQRQALGLRRVARETEHALVGRGAQQVRVVRHGGRSSRVSNTRHARREARGQWRGAHSLLRQQHLQIAAGLR